MNEKKPSPEERLEDLFELDIRISDLSEERDADSTTFTHTQVTLRIHN